MVWYTVISRWGRPFINNASFRLPWRSWHPQSHILYRELQPDNRKPHSLASVPYRQNEFRGISKCGIWKRFRKRIGKDFDLSNKCGDLLTSRFCLSSPNQNNNLSMYLSLQRLLYLFEGYYVSYAIVWSAARPLKPFKPSKWILKSALKSGELRRNQDFELHLLSESFSNLFRNLTPYC